MFINVCQTWTAVNNVDSSPVTTCRFVDPRRAVTVLAYTVSA